MLNDHGERSRPTEPVHEGPDCQVVEPDKGGHKDQPATAQMSAMDIPLDHTQGEAIPLVEWASHSYGELQVQGLVG